MYRPVSICIGTLYLLAKRVVVILCKLKKQGKKTSRYLSAVGTSVVTVLEF